MGDMRRCGQICGQMRHRVRAELREAVEGESHRGLERVRLLVEGVAEGERAAAHGGEEACLIKRRAHELVARSSH